MRTVEITRQGDSIVVTTRYEPQDGTNSTHCYVFDPPWSSRFLAKWFSGYMPGVEARFKEVAT